MSNQLKTSAFRHLSKRKISISVTQAGASDSISTTFRESLASSIGTKDKEVTVSDYLKHINAPYKLTGAIQEATRVEIIDPTENSIRSALLLNDSEKLKSSIHEITSAIDFKLVDTLSNSEISLFLNRLINIQATEMSNLDRLKFPIAKSKFTEFYNQNKFLSHQIQQLGVHLLNTQRISVIDATNILEMLINNQNYNSASLWIAKLDEIQFAKGLRYENLKLKALGKASTILHSKVYSKAAKSELVQGSVSWSSLMEGFQSNSSNFIPNLETHKIFINGLSKYSSIEQIARYVNSVWGINKNHPPKALIDRSSSIYPDTELLEILISSYATHNQLLDIFPILTKFEKYYKFDLTKSTFIWRTLLQNIHTHYKDEQTRLTIFDNVWTLIQNKKVRFSTRLYTLRLGFLREKGSLEEAFKDLKEIQKQYYLEYSRLESLRIRKLMSGYLKFIIEQLCKQDQGNSSSYKKLIYAYSFDKEQKEYLLAKAKEINKSVEAELKKFFDLQKQYDQEDDEDSLW